VIGRTLFWPDRWCGDVPFRARFGRLLDLALNKSMTVKDMFTLGWGVGVKLGSDVGVCGFGRKSY